MGIRRMSPRPIASRSTTVTVELARDLDAVLKQRQRLENRGLAAVVGADENGDAFEVDARGVAAALEALDRESSEHVGFRATPPILRQGRLTEVPALPPCRRWAILAGRSCDY